METHMDQRETLHTIGKLYVTEVIGTCSKCQGPVSAPKMWSGLVPPVPTCQRCGATKKKSFGPVIEMD